MQISLRAQMEVTITSFFNQPISNGAFLMLTINTTMSLLLRGGKIHTIFKMNHFSITYDLRKMRSPRENEIQIPCPKFKKVIGPYYSRRVKTI